MSNIESIFAIGGFVVGFLAGSMLVVWLIHSAVKMRRGR